MPTVIDSTPPESANDWTSDEHTDAGVEAPPQPQGVSADAAYLGQMQAWNTRVVIRDTRKGTKAVLRKLEKVSVQLADIDKDVEAIPKAPPTGAVQRITAWIDSMPTVKSALVNFLVIVLGIATTGATGYATFRMAGWQSTPTAVPVIAQPVTITPTAEAATPAPVVTIDPATVED
jgi:hypothetical protein